MDGYMEENKICIPCKFPCSECAGKVDFCKSCGHGFYKVGSTCIPCNNLCKECNNSEDFCT